MKLKYLCVAILLLCCSCATTVKGGKDMDNPDWFLETRYTKATVEEQYDNGTLVSRNIVMLPEPVMSPFTNAIFQFFSILAYPFKSDSI